MKMISPYAEDLTGRKFHRLTVISRAPGYPGGGGGTRWHCMCDCGNKTISGGTELRKGKTKSCGCYSREFLGKPNWKHHGHKDRLYEAWTSIKQRCLNPKHPVYHHYGARGITICDEWLNDYAAFRDYIGDAPSEKHTVDRIDNDGNYEPGNVRWATRAEQSRNRRTNQMITYEGRTMCFADWVRETGIPHTTLHYRLFTAKWPIDKAFKR